MAATASNPRGRWTRPDLPAWAISIALHGVILLVLSLVTWAAARSTRMEVQVYLLPDDVSRGLLSAAGGAGRGGDVRHERADGERIASATAIPRPSLSPPVAPAGRADPSSAAPMTPAPRQDPAMAMVGSILKPASSDDPSRPAGRGGNGDLVGPGGAGRGQAIDVVFVIDATRSISPYIERVRNRALRTMSLIAGMLESLGQRRGARFGVVAFKDYGDEYGPIAVRREPLTEDLDTVRRFIADIQAGGGADESEPIDRALEAATSVREMGWNRTRRAMIILITDAPTHALGREAALEHARQWVRRIGEAQVMVIDTGGTADAGVREQILPDLLRIAEAGGGRALLLNDEEAYWRFLIVWLFGERHASSVPALVEKHALPPEDGP